MKPQFMVCMAVFKTVVDTLNPGTLGFPACSLPKFYADTCELCFVAYLNTQSTAHPGKCFVNHDGYVQQGGAEEELHPCLPPISFGGEE